MKRIDLTGKVFGKLTVLRKDDVRKKDRFYLCKCECGKEKSIRGASLTAGNTKSCGCLKAAPKKNKDMIGKKIGRLTITAEVEGGHISPNGAKQRAFICRCECGNVKRVLMSNLKRGHTISCGCARKDFFKRHLKSFNEQSHPEKVNMIAVKFALDGKLRPTNTSGVTGVSRVRSGNFQVYLNLKGKRMNLGTYTTIEEAKRVRLEAEKEYFQPMLEKYEVKGSLYEDR